MMEARSGLSADAITASVSNSASAGLHGTFLDYCSLSHMDQLRLANGTEVDRIQALVEIPSLSSSCSSSAMPSHLTSNNIHGDNQLGGKHEEKMTVAEIAATIQRQAKMTMTEELAAVLFLAVGPPCGVITLPLLTAAFGRFVLGEGKIGLAFRCVGLYVLLPLAIIPQRFVPSTLTCYLSHLVVKYFSFRFITVDAPSSSLDSTPPVHPTHPTVAECFVDSAPVSRRPQILVAPPHGVFPYGNILAMMIWPVLTGHSFRGLASSSALRPPLFKQILRSIGVIDASRESATSALQTDPFVIGISTGGVAEVFETNAEDECIILRERIGVIKLAIRTGADLVPCYLFGNTMLFSCWAGEGIPGARNILEKISRKIGFALIFFYGRLLLPIPRRIPVLGVRGKPIPTHHLNGTSSPTPEQIVSIQNQLVDGVQALFDDHKHFYGWDHKKLIIK